MTGTVGASRPISVVELHLERLHDVRRRVGAAFSIDRPAKPALPPGGGQQSFCSCLLGGVQQALSSLRQGQARQRGPPSGVRSTALVPEVLATTHTSTRASPNRTSQHFCPSHPTVLSTKETGPFRTLSLHSHPERMTRRPIGPVPSGGTPAASALSETRSTAHERPSNWRHTSSPFSGAVSPTHATN